MGLKPLVGKEVLSRIEEHLSGSTVEADDSSVVIKSEAVDGVMRFLKDSPEFAFDYLTSVTAVDYLEYFEVVYHLTSIDKKHTLVVKTRCYTRENPEVPSVTPLWQGADFQEREIYDLMGIRFAGHPNLKRIALWEGFQGHPLRKDFFYVNAKN